MEEGLTGKRANGPTGQPRKKLLVTGAGGFVGRHVCRKAALDWQVLGLIRSRREGVPGVAYHSIDLTDLSATAAVFKEYRPDAVIHLAAMSGLSACQRDPASSYRINVDVSRRIAELCAETSIPCVFSSTDIVFDGRRPPYRETDPVNPVNVYGEHKALAEVAMQEVCPNVSICRLSLVFGMDGLFVRPDGRAISEGSDLKLFVDEYRTPVRAGRLAEGLLMALGAVSPAAVSSAGILHLGGADRVSRYDFGQMIAETFSFKRVRLSACRQKDVDLGAPRPADVSLDITKSRRFGFCPAALGNELKSLLV